MKHLFNFDCNAQVSPNYRVEYSDKTGFEVSSPAIFFNDNDAIRAALEHLPFWLNQGVNIVKVYKYYCGKLQKVYYKQF